MKKNNVVHELLCPPSLLYRHAPSYTLLQEATRKETSDRDVSRWKTEMLHCHRVKARFFDATVQLTSKRPRLELDQDLPQSPPRDPLSIPETTCGEESVEEHQRKVLQEIRTSMFPNSAETVVSMARMDRTYQPANLHIQFGPRFAKELATGQRRTARERTNASPEYLAPFQSDVLAWGVGDHWHVPRDTEELESQLERRNVGNCLVSFRCPCCDSTRCLIHPIGDMLSMACVSTLEMPQEAGSTNCSEKPTRSASRREVEIGERILQISECSSWNTGICYFLIRSSNYSTVVSLDCLGSCMFRMKLIQRIDMRSLSSSHQSFRPRHVAAHPRYGNSFTESLIAVVSKIQNAQTANVVHCGVDAPVKHYIGNLQNIELIEFSSLHPMVLNAAASSYIRPALVPNLVSRRPMLGTGSSLYTIDLRSNQAAFQWSPSASEFVTENVHSISGIHSDLNNENSLFIASISASKLWEIDSRMPCAVLNSWSLAGLHQSIGKNSHRGDLHGGRTILHQPRNEYRDETQCPFLSVDTSVDSYDFCLYQQPLFSPLLETQSLEISCGPGLKGVSLARSRSFQLPDVSSKVFTCGITSFRDCVSTILTSDQRDRLAYEDAPLKALTVVTMTNIGDLYSSVLLECSDREVMQNVTEGGSGIGAIKNHLFVPKVGDENNPIPKSFVRRINGGFRLRTVLSDVPAVPSSKITKTIMERRSDCESFMSIPLHEIRQQCLGDECTDGAFFSASEKMNAATKDLRASTNAGLNRFQKDVSHDLVALGSQIWTSPSLER